MVEPVQNQKAPQEDFVGIVDYRANKSLSELGVACHWWDAGHTSLHRHNHYEFFIITSGRTRHALNGTDETLEENTLLLIRPRDVHQFAPLAGSKCIHINISATPKCLARLCDALGVPLAQLAHNDGAPLRAALSRDEMAFFMNRASQLNYLVRDESEPSALRLAICEMLVQAVALIYKQRALPHDDRPQWLRDVLERLHAPEMMDCSAEDVYRLAGYSAPVVIRYFRRYTGGTVCAYLARLKMDWAVRLLRGADMTTLEVAQALGYASLSHFGKLFTQHTGLCPRAFRARQAAQFGGAPPG